MKESRLAIYDDFTLLLIVDCLIYCTDVVDDAQVRYSIGWFILALTLQYIIFHLGRLMMPPTHKMKLCCKKCYVIRKATKGKTVSYVKTQFGKSVRKIGHKIKSSVSSSDTSNRERNEAKAV